MVVRAMIQMYDPIYREDDTMAKQPTRFPSEALVSKGGEIYCHVFENQYTGIARNLFWSVTVKFAPIQYGNQRFDCSLTCDWIPWPVRNWRELDGRHLDVEYGENDIEASFYMTEHHLATRIRLSLAHQQANLFRVAVDLLVDFDGYYSGDEDPAMPVRGEMDIPFIGLLVNPGNLFPKPVNLSDVRKVLLEFVDLSAYCEPEPQEGDGFIFRPAVES